MDTEALRGLAEDDAARLLEAFGANELPRASGRGLGRIVRETMREPMFLLLLGAAGIYLAIGDVGEGVFLLGGAVAAIGLVILQEARSERALAALRDLSQPFARVLRDGVERRIAVRELVPGDIVLVGEGERAPADAVLLAGDVLGVDESALTGESAPVTKQPDLDGAALDADVVPGAATSALLFAGTLVTRGQGVARVTRTGPRTSLGKIGGSLAAMEEDPTPLQKTAGRVVVWLGVLALAFCGVVAAAYGVLRDDWIGGALAGVTVAIALIPEEFPMVLAVFLALGAWRLATHRVLVRRSAVIESLGAATVLCVDKTGTLTENRMRVARLWSQTAEAQISADERLDDGVGVLLDYAALASAVRPVDPMDRAVRRLLERSGRTLGTAEPEPRLILPLRPDRMAVIQVWRSDADWLAAAKGAPEAIFALCALSPTEVERLSQTVHRFADEGLRVLGVASSRTSGGDPGAAETAAYRFEGLIGFVDPVREDAPAALREARAAGISVVMITGDHAATALAVARLAGVDVAGGVLQGPELEALSAEELAERLRRVRVFARITPDQKLRIVQGLRADGEVVAMTGDGINDAPALEAADIGVAMGRKGTDVAREAADLVLLDDSFASIVGGVRLGRRIFTNLRKALVYITAIHVPVAGVALAPVLLGLPPLLYPMHVVLLELAIDPICALVFESEPSERRSMLRPPRPRGESLFGPAQIAMALTQGASVLIAVMAVYLWALDVCPEAQARAAAFVTLVAGNLLLALADTVSTGGRLFATRRLAYWAITLATAGILTLVLAAPGPAAMFRLQAPGLGVLAAALAAAALSAGWLVALQRIRAALARRSAPIHAGNV